MGVELDRLRDEIDAADDAILEAIEARIALGVEAAAIKAAEGCDNTDQERERDVIAHYRAAGCRDLARLTSFERIARAIIDATKIEQVRELRREAKAKHGSEQERAEGSA